MPTNKMKIYDATNYIADVTIGNVHEVADWWLFRKAYETLHFDRLNRQIERIAELDHKITELQRQRR